MLQKHRSTKKRIIFYGMCYWFILVISYIWSLQNFWAESWPVDFNIWKMFLATGTVFVMFTCLSKEDSIINTFLVILLYIVVLPIATIYVCQNRETIYYLLVFISFLVVETAIRSISTRNVNIMINEINPSGLVVFSFAMLLLTSLVVMVRERGMPSLESIDFSQTYEIRSSYEISSMASMLFQIVTRAVVPCFLAIALLKKNYRMAVVFLGIQALYFLWLANKTTLFSIGVFIIGYFIANSKKGTLLFSRLITIGIGSISLLEGLNPANDRGIFRLIYQAYSLLVRRAIYIPGYLKFSYYDFFILKNNPKVGMLGTVIAPILTRFGVKSPYGESSFSKTVGIYYLNESNANTGIFGRELAHFGIIGVFIAALLLLIFLVCVKRSEKANGRIFTSCVGIYTIVSLADGGSIDMIDFSPMLMIAFAFYLFNLREYQIKMQCEQPKHFFLFGKRKRK